MSRIAIDRILAPSVEYRVRRGRTDTLKEFEGRPESYQEDLCRMRRCRSVARAHSVYTCAATALADRIKRSMDRCSRSLASATYMRDLRIRVTGQLWSLASRTSNIGPRTSTLFIRGWEVPAGQLHTFDPTKRLAALRSLINRCGGDHADGYLIAFVHGEFEPRRGVYQMHLHILAAGGLRDVLHEKVRRTALVRSSRSDAGETDFVFQRLRQDPPLTDLPRPLTYLVKSFWPSKWQGFTPTGELKRQRKGSRIAEPYHTEVLLWLDRWQLSDLTLMMNLSVDRTGFRLSDRAYTNGDDA